LGKLCDTMTKMIGLIEIDKFKVLLFNYNNQKENKVNNYMKILKSIAKSELEELDAKEYLWKNVLQQLESI
jgi:hypothetical protein